MTLLESENQENEIKKMFWKSKEKLANKSQI